MGIASTITVTRQHAMSAIHAKLAQLNDRELANVLDQVVHNGFYNFMVDDKNPDWDLKQLMETEFNNAY